MLDLIVETFRSLRAHALRFVLTSLGITWGAFMLTYATATMQGLDGHFRREMENTGQRLVYVFPGTIIKDRVGERGARPVELEVEDVERLVDFTPIDGSEPSLVLWSQVVQGDGRIKQLSVTGVGPQSEWIRNWSVAHGRYLSATDVEAARRVAFLGAEAARRLFGRAPPVGRQIRIEGKPFRVVGVGVEKGEQLVGFGGRDDQAVLIPYTAAQRWLVGHDHVTQLVFAPVERPQSYAAIERARESFGLHHGFAPSVETALSFINVHDIMLILDNLMFGLRLFLVAAALITLAVGAVGVTNIMLVVVAERTREIGLRKAVGAPRRAIFLAFLAEAGTVCVLSGTVGALAGVGLARWIAEHSDPATLAISPPEVSAGAVLAVVATLVTVGVLAGVLPAWRAARVPPAEALRSH